jgi:hypothetical protein
LQVSFVGCGSGENEKIAFNYGRELFVYPYRGIRKSSEAKLLDKRVYKVSIRSSVTKTALFDRGRQPLCTDIPMNFFCQLISET